MVRRKYIKDLDITFIDGQYIDVLKSARDMIHKGAKLINHPLMGSVKPNETPFRSIILSKGTELNIESLAMIESSIAVTEKFQRNSKTPAWNEKVMDDFRVVDMELFESALESI